MQTILTLLIKLCKTILVKYNLKQNIIFLVSSHDFFINITADMIHDLKDSHTQRPLPPIKCSHQLSTIFKNTLDDPSDNSLDPTNTSTKPSRIHSPPPFYTKRPKRLQI